MTGARAYRFRSLIKQKDNSHFHTHKSPTEDVGLIKDEQKRGSSLSQVALLKTLSLKNMNSNLSVTTDHWAPGQLRGRNGVSALVLQDIKRLLKGAVICELERGLTSGVAAVF